ncbi:MAG: hypothetical protein AAF911_05845 [Planctomycetota bacterium]
MSLLSSPLHELSLTAVFIYSNARFLIQVQKYHNPITDAKIWGDKRIGRLKSGIDRLFRRAIPPVSDFVINIMSFRRNVKIIAFGLFGLFIFSLLAFGIDSDNSILFEWVIAFTLACLALILYGLGCIWMATMNRFNDGRYWYLWPFLLVGVFTFGPYAALLNILIVAMTALFVTFCRMSLFSDRFSIWDFSIALYGLLAIWI